MKYLKYPVLIIASLLLIILLILTIINFTSLNFSKPYITELVSDVLGRDLKLNGDIKIKYFPPHLSIKDVQLKNAEWAEKEYFITADNIDVKLKLEPLFWGEVQISRINLDGINLNLVRNENNGGNWEFDLNKSTDISSEEQKITNEALPILPFDSNVKINLNKISLILNDQINKQTHNLLINKLVIDNNNNLTQININANYNEIDLKLDLQTVLLKNILIKETIPLTINGNIGNTKLDIKTDVPLTRKHAESMSVYFAVNMHDLSTIETLIKQPLPKLGEIDLKGNIVVSNNQLRLNLQPSSIGKTELKGELDYLTKQEKPAIKTKLEFAELDLTVLEQFEKIQSEADETANESDSLFSDKKLDLSILNKINADLDINIQRVDHDFMELEKVELKAVLENGLLNISKLKAQNKREESLNIQLYLDSKKNNKLDIEFSTDNLQLAKNATLADYLTGAVTNININLKGEGDSVKKIVSSLDGNFIVKVGEGTVSDDILKFIGSNILMDLVDAINPISDSSTSSNLECAVIRLDVKKGVASADKSIVMQTDKIQIISSGIIDLKNETLEFGIKPQAREGVEINLNSLASMVKISGPLKNPSISMSVKDTAVVYSYFATGGATFLAKSLFDTATRDETPCKTAILDSNNN